MDLKIFDINGKWLINSGAFPFVDPTNGCRFEPNVPTQAPVTDWTKAQPSIKEHKMDTSAKK